MTERYRASDRAEHECCYGAVVEDLTQPEMISGEHYENQYAVVCECSDMETAEMIAAALNAREGQ